MSVVGTEQCVRDKFSILQTSASKVQSKNQGGNQQVSNLSWKIGRVRQRFSLYLAKFGT